MVFANAPTAGAWQLFYVWTQQGFSNNAIKLDLQNEQLGNGPYSGHVGADWQDIAQHTHLMANQNYRTALQLEGWDAAAILTSAKSSCRTS